MVSLGKSPFVGRESELASLRATCDAAMAGTGRIVMLAGEPGIGKTRTASELVEYAKVLGLLAAQVGRRDHAIQHFDSAARLCHGAGYRPGYAWNAYSWAGVLAGPAASDGTKSDEITGVHKEQGLSLLDEALDISQELGMGPLTNKALLLQETIRVQLAHVTEYADGLIRREVEVLRVLAQGRSNPQIGEELFISLNTVTRHLSHIYTKTNTANRAEVVVYVAKQGLI